MEDGYRKRIYGAYVSGRTDPLAPQDLEGLEARGPLLRRLIEHHFPANRDAVILDLGCGHGALVHFARKAGYSRILGVDASSEQVAAAHRLGIERVAEGDVLDTLASYPSGSVGCVVCFDLLEHFNRDELLSVVDDIKRVLELGGILIVHSPNGESPFASRMRYGDLTHEIAFTRTSIAQLLYASGFSDIRSYEDRPAVHGFKSGARWVLWRVIRGILRAYVAAETGETQKVMVFTQNFVTIARS